MNTESSQATQPTQSTQSSRPTAPIADPTPAPTAVKPESGSRLDADAIPKPVAYRILSPDEWSKLEFLSAWGSIPNPSTAWCAIAQDADTDEILSVLFLQLALHMEPLWIREGEARRVNYLRLTRMLEDAIRKVLGQATYYVFTPDGRVARMAKVNGMSHTPYHVWVKEVK